MNEDILVVVGSSPQVKLYSTEGGYIGEVPLPHTTRVRWASLSPDRTKLLTSGGASSAPLVVLDTATWDVLYTFPGSGLYGYPVFSPDSRRIYCRDNVTPIAINAATGAVELAISGSTVPNDTFAVSPDGTRFTLTRDAGITTQEYDAVTGASLWSRSAGSTESNPLYSLNQDLILTRASQTLRKFSTLDYAPAGELTVHPNFNVLATADPEIIVHVGSLSPYNVTMSNLYTGEVVASLSGVTPADRYDLSVDLATNTLWVHRVQTGVPREILAYSLEGREFTLVRTIGLSGMPGSYSHFAVAPAPPPPGAFWTNFLRAWEV